MYMHMPNGTQTLWLYTDLLRVTVMAPDVESLSCSNTEGEEIATLHV